MGPASSWAENAWSTSGVSDANSRRGGLDTRDRGRPQGRQDFANSVSDFRHLPWLPRGSTRSPGSTTTSSRPYAYLPTSPPADHRSRTRSSRMASRLEPATSGFDPGQDLHQPDHQRDPAITADNNGHALPSPTHHPGGPGRGIRRDLAADPVLRLPIPERLVRSYSGQAGPTAHLPAGARSPERIQRSHE